MDQAGGFSYTDYDVMDRSCNTFTYELTKRLRLDDKYPHGILNQSKFGEILAPVVHAIDLFLLGSGLNKTCSDCQDDKNEFAPSCIRRPSTAPKGPFKR